MAGHRHRDPSFSQILDGTFALFPTEPTTPGADPIPATHTLAVLLDRALSPRGLDDRDLRVLSDEPIRAWATIVRTFWLRAKVAHATGHATPENLGTLRRDALTALASITDPQQRQPGSTLDRYLAHRDKTTIRPPANGRRLLREAMANPAKALPHLREDPR
ncbi:hypothetical protein QBL07_018010 [Gordonia rubripertincta]|uniref:DUF222 domain-containing protein n=1 Tax=Gordonia rubripertincta TaxID=36822 RepID=A0AAW6R2V5_GORRU|nr:hypothetical protein [Gordonia rubripertincta]MDG6779574.1 hypothetical protein [Gordonia rubripertincta]NKY62880.1 hypothetical protein [Gordonia rubripertincta]